MQGAVEFFQQGFHQQQSRPPALCFPDVAAGDGLEFLFQLIGEAGAVVLHGYPVALPVPEGDFTQFYADVQVPRGMPYGVADQVGEQVLDQVVSLDDTAGDRAVIDPDIPARDVRNVGHYFGQHLPEVDLP